MKQQFIQALWLCLIDFIVVFIVLYALAVLINLFRKFFHEGKK